MNAMIVWNADRRVWELTDGLTVLDESTNLDRITCEHPTAQVDTTGRQGF